SSTPLDSNSLVIVDEDNIEITTFTVSGADVTFSSGAADGDRVLEKVYTYTTRATTQEIEIDATKFPKAMKLILETIEINEDEEPIFTIQYQFDKVIFDGSFTVETSSERTASAHNSTLQVLKPSNSDIIGRVLRIPYQ